MSSLRAQRVPVQGEVLPPGTCARAVRRSAARLLGRCVCILVLAVVAMGAADKKSASKKPRNVTFDTIKLKMEAGDPFDKKLLTPDVKKLIGKNIMIRGYILPSFKQRGIKQFVLVRDNMECCFGPGAALYDCILVQMAPGKTTSYSYRPIAVEGVFEIETFEGPDGYPLAIYRIQATLAR